MRTRVRKGCTIPTNLSQNIGVAAAFSKGVSCSELVCLRVPIFQGLSRSLPRPQLWLKPLWSLPPVCYFLRVAPDSCLVLHRSNPQRPRRELHRSNPQGPRRELHTSNPQGPRRELHRSNLQGPRRELHRSDPQRPRRELHRSNPQGPRRELHRSNPQGPRRECTALEYDVYAAGTICSSRSRAGRFSMSLCYLKREGQDSPLIPSQRRQAHISVQENFDKRDNL
jgi:hypothetical protein